MGAGMYEDRIVRDPKILAGKPTVRGTRVPVELVLRHLARTLDPADVLRAYPRLTEDDIRACLEYGVRAAGGESLMPPLVPTKP
jgi:uncharacterized protein (DUF433 family)